MRLDDIVELVAQHGAEKYIEKCAGLRMPVPLAVGVGTGLMFPTVFNKGHTAYQDTQQMLDLAAHQQLDDNVALKHAGIADWLNANSLGKGTAKGPTVNQSFAGGVHKGIGGLAGAPLEGLAKGFSGGIGSMMSNAVDRHFRDFGERKDPLHMMGTSAMSAFGSEMGSTGANLLRDMANKAMASVGAAGDQSARTAILKQLKHEDPILAEAQDHVLMDAFHTMSRFAPTLSTDKNAVRSFLRQAVMSGTGPDYASIKLLADSEYAVTGRNKKD